ncbi:alkaline phosphatase family protein [Nocardioides sp.]|uniref:alkaline phosphatase family protein n=1 Tax=Nocardioides sp. TaxID=35761 RepID=UPI0027337C38|nr:nucleotide pyrophosphatase/phosphodiesterase family protein [Nocardioides sp.]MDP3890168.1 alkaline phosphatase family protein [Nocardioides sp.]
MPATSTAPRPGDPALTFLSPDYGGRSLGDVLPAVAHALGAGHSFARPGLVLPPAQKYVVFLVDGLGHDLLRDHADAAPYLHSLLTEGGTPPLTVGVPSTTATSLTSLGTGLTPGEHGMIGFSSRIPGTDDLLFSLLWDDRIDPHEWQPHPTAFARLEQAGVTTTVVNKRDFEHSGLTRVGNRGATFVGADSPAEQLAAAVAATGAAPSLTYLYDSDLDSTGHRHGCGSWQWEDQLAAIDLHVEQVRDVLPPDVRLLVVADHGMVDSPPESRLDLAADPALREGVRIFGGEARFRQLYCEGGAADDVAAAWREAVAGRAEVLTRGEAVTRGWFGPLDPTVLPRVGDVLVAAYDDFTVVDTERWSFEAELVGFHGSLTRAEMLVPALLA